MEEQKCCEEVKVNMDCNETSCEDNKTNRMWTPEEEQAVIECKRWRQQLDAILQDIKGAVRGSRERSLLITKMQEAIMWAGMDLKALNDGRTIYPDSYDPSNTYVAPTADGLKL